jgi:chromosome segregation ATPase
MPAQISPSSWKSVRSSGASLEMTSTRDSVQAMTTALTLGLLLGSAVPVHAGMIYKENDIVVASTSMSPTKKEVSKPEVVKKIPTDPPKFRFAEEQALYNAEQTAIEFKGRLADTTTSIKEMQSSLSKVKAQEKKNEAIASKLQAKINSAKNDDTKKIYQSEERTMLSQLAQTRREVGILNTNLDKKNEEKKSIMNRISQNDLFMVAKKKDVAKRIEAANKAEKDKLVAKEKAAKDKAAFKKAGEVKRATVKLHGDEVQAKKLTSQVKDVNARLKAFKGSLKQKEDELYSAKSTLAAEEKKLERVKKTVTQAQQVFEAERKKKDGVEQIAMDLQSQLEMIKETVSKDKAELKTVSK